MSNWTNPPLPDDLPWLAARYQLEVDRKIITRDDRMQPLLDLGRGLEGDTLDGAPLIQQWQVRRLEDGVILGEWNR